MRLALKFTLTYAATTCLVLGAANYSRILREARMFERDIHRDHNVLGRDLALAASRFGSILGEDAVVKFLDQANHDLNQLTIRYVPDMGLALAAVGAEESEADGGDPVSVRSSDAQGEWMNTYVPLAARDGERGAVEIRESLSEARRYMRMTIVRSIAWLVLVVLSCTATALALGTVVVARPVRLLVEKARQIARGEFSQPLVLRQADELSELAHEMSLMADRLLASERLAVEERSARVDTLRQLRHADRLTTVGALASAIAHELGTPLSVIAARAKMISSGEVEGDAVADGARTIVSQTERMTEILRQLMGFARRPIPRKERLDLRRVLRQTVALLRPIADQQDVSMHLDPGLRPAMAAVDPDQIQQALSNLMLNGMQAMPDGGRLWVRMESAQPHQGAGDVVGRRACIVVEDEGCGIPEDQRELIFQPFFTTKSSSNGTGLGLSIAVGILQEHGGEINVESAPGAGARFLVYLPVED